MPISDTAVAIRNTRKWQYLIQICGNTRHTALTIPQTYQLETQITAHLGHTYIGTLNGSLTTQYLKYLLYSLCDRQTILQRYIPYITRLHQRMLKHMHTRNTSLNLATPQALPTMAHNAQQTRQPEGNTPSPLPYLMSVNKVWALGASLPRR